jgi:hypothetical protein
MIDVVAEKPRNEFADGSVRLTVDEIFAASEEAGGELYIDDGGSVMYRGDASKLGATAANNIRRQLSAIKSAIGDRAPVAPAVNTQIKLTDFIASGQMVWVDSKALGGEFVLLAGDEVTQSQIKNALEANPGTVCYQGEELRLLVGITPDQLLYLHGLKQMFPPAKLEADDTKQRQSGPTQTTTEGLA